MHFRAVLFGVLALVFASSLRAGEAVKSAPLSFAAM